MKKKKIWKHYIDYDADETFKQDLSKLDEDQKEKLLKERSVRWIYAEKEITAGKIKEIEIYPEFTRTQAKNEKTIRKKSKAQKNLNSKNARKKLERLINANFGDGDLWVTLTYDDEHHPSSIDEAVKKMNYFIKKINRIRKKKGLGNAKYIYVTEYSGRCHEHMIIDHGLTMDELEEAWPYGRRNNTRKIAEDENGLTGLAKYISKDPKGKKRWNSSKGLKQPKERKNHQISMKKIRSMADDENMIEIYAKKKYPHRQILETERKFNEYNGMFYFYIRFGGEKGDEGRNE